MAKSRSYYLQWNGVEEGPMTVAQINRMKQRREITADTPCRADDGTAFRRLDEVLPHLKDYKGLDAEKMSRLKQDIDTVEIKSLTAAAFGSGALFWAPFVGAYGSLAGIACGIALLFKHRQPIGLGAIALGFLGLFFRFYRLW